MCMVHDVYGVWCMVYMVYMVHRVYDVHGAYGAWCVWCMMYMVYMVHDVYGVWCMVCMVYGLWNGVHRAPLWGTYGGCLFTLFFPHIFFCFCSNSSGISPFPLGKKGHRTDSKISSSSSLSVIVHHHHHHHHHYQSLFIIIIIHCVSIPPSIQWNSLTIISYIM